MLITLPRGYEKNPFASLLSFIHIVYFSFPFTVIVWNKGKVTTVSLRLIHLKGYNFNQSILPDAL